MIYFPHPIMRAVAGVVPRFDAGHHFADEPESAWATACH